MEEIETEDEGYDQGAFRLERVQTRRGAKSPRRSREIIDVGAFKQLIRSRFDARPSDVPESVAAKRAAKKAKEKGEKK